MAPTSKPSATSPPASRRKARREKHVPVRTCIVCRDRSAKRSLTRIVRTPEGQVIVDRTGRANGRGAYICDNPACWSRALSHATLSRALKTEISAEDAGRLQELAASLPQGQAAAGLPPDDEP